MENNKDENRKGADQLIIDLARRAVSSSVKSLLSTEEGIRNIISAILPKDLVKDLLIHVEGQFDEFRKDLVKTLGREIRHFGEKVDIAAEIKKVLDGMELDLQMKLALKNKTKDKKKKK